MSLKNSFLNICLTFTAYLTIILCLAIFGFFSYWSVLVVTIIFILTALFFLLRNLKKTEKGSLNLIKISCFILILLFVLVIGFFRHDLPTGRDDLSYVYAANRLVDTHSLKWEDYFSRPVHGVRNLGGDSFTSQFLPLYVVYLAVYYQFGGLDLLLLANVLLMLLAFSSIYYLVKNLAGEKASLLALIFFFTSYIFYWFPKRTNVENIFFFLIWFGLLLLIEGINKKKSIYFLGGLIPFSLLPLARAEGLVFFLFYLLVVLVLFLVRFKKEIKERLFLKIWPLLVVAINILLFYCYLRFYQASYIINQVIDVFEGFPNFFQNWSVLTISFLLLAVLIFLLVIFRKKVNFQKFLFWLIVLAILGFELTIVSLVQNHKLTWGIFRSQYVLISFTFYFYFLYFFIVLIGLKRKIFTNKELWLILPLLPAFFFLIEPNIALDHPWFMRRFFPNLIPLFLVLSAVSLIRQNLSKKHLSLFVSLIVVVGLALTYPIFFFVEHKGIKNQIENFNSLFSKNALILMNPGWSWQKIAILQHYFYGYDTLPNFYLYRYEESKNELPKVLAQYPDWQSDDNKLVSILNWQNDKSENYVTALLAKYPEVYAVTDQTGSNLFNGFKDENLEKVGSFIFNYQELHSRSNITGYIRKNKIIELNEIRDLQGMLPPHELMNQEIKLDVYKIKKPQEYVPFEYVLDINQIQGRETNYKLLEEVDLMNYRKDLTEALRDIDLGI